MATSVSPAHPSTSALRAGSVTLLDLPVDFLQCILALLPAREAFCVAHTCKAFAAALRALSEISVDIILDLATEEGEPAGQPRDDPNSHPKVACHAEGKAANEEGERAGQSRMSTPKRYPAAEP